MEPKPKFKIGDRVTFKPINECRSKDGSPNSYYYGGNDYGGTIATVINVNKYKSEKNCFEIMVSFNSFYSNNVEYNMIESEFVEYSQSEKPMPASESKTPTPLMRKKLIKINQSF